jgi:hypothetical protein
MPSTSSPYLPLATNPLTISASDGTLGSWYGRQINLKTASNKVRPPVPLSKALMTNQTITRKLYGSSTATTNDLAHIDLPFACRLIGVQMGVIPAAVSNSDSVKLEVSTASVGQVTTNDAQNVLCMAFFAYTLATSGATQPGVNSFVGPLSMALPAGTRVYLHTVQSGTNATGCTAILHLQPA